MEEEETECNDSLSFLSNPWACVLATLAPTLKESFTARFFPTALCTMLYCST